MNSQLEKIKPNFVNRIDKFGDKKKSSNVEEMEKVYFNTKFAPCPAGFFIQKVIGFTRLFNVELYQLLKAFIIILTTSIQTIL